MVNEQHAAFFKQAHERKQKFYNDNQNLDYIPTAEEKVHAQFDAKNVDVDDQGNRTARVHITQVHRVRRGGFKNDNESVYFYEEHNGHDHRGNEIQKFVVNGKYDIPVGQFQFDELSGVNVCTGIARHDTIYPINYTPKLLYDLVEKGEIDGTTTYYVETVGGRQYSGFEYEDFRNMSFEDLVFLGKTGAHPEQQIQEVRSRDKKIASGTKE